MEQNALIPYNDAFQDYIDMLLQNEKAEQSQNRERIEKLQEAKITHSEKKKFHDSLKDIPKHRIKSEDIFKMKDTMVSMRHYGKSLGKIIGKSLCKYHDLM